MLLFFCLKKSETARLFSPFFEQAVAIFGDGITNDIWFEEEYPIKLFLDAQGFSPALVESQTHGNCDNEMGQVYVNRILEEKGCFVKQESVHFSDHNVLCLYIKTCKE